MAKPSTPGSRAKRRKARRRPPVGVARAPVAARPRVAPMGSSRSSEEPAATPKPKVPGLMDFSYVGVEVRRIAVFCVFMVGLLIVLSFVLR